MKAYNLRYIITGIALLALPEVASADEITTRHQRNYVHQGNELYKQKRYSEAEVAYNKALEINPASEIVNYNYAMSLLNQAQPSDQPAEDNPLGMALKRLTQLMEAENKVVAELAAYNLGNQSFGKENYKEAIEFYKRSLMKNPDNDQARENLRLAQLKLKEQQNQNQNQDKNQDQQNKDQDQQQNQQDQQNQDQNQKDQNQDQQDQNKQDQQPNKDQQQPQQLKQQGISPENAQKILNTVEKAEAATRAKVDEKKKEEERRAVGRPHGNQW